jgi:hypothetical protein
MFGGNHTDPSSSNNLSCAKMARGFMLGGLGAPCWKLHRFPIRHQPRREINGQRVRLLGRTHSFEYSSRSLFLCNPVEQEWILFLTNQIIFYFLGLSQSERVHFYYFRFRLVFQNEHYGRIIKPWGRCFLNFFDLFKWNPIKYKFSKYLPLGFAFHRLVLQLSAFKERRMQGHSRIGQKRVIILKEVKRRHISGNI